MQRKSSDRPTTFALPAWALAALYAGIVALALLLALLRGEAPVDFWTEAAAATGIAGGVMLLLQVVSSGRFRILSGRIGIDVTMGFHRWAAPVALILVLAHPILLAGPVDWSNPGQALNRLINMFTSPRLIDGVAAFVVMVVLIALALGRERIAMRYEIWRAMHAILALALVGLTVYHALEHGFYASEGAMRVFWPVLGLCVVVPMLSVYLRKWLSLQRHGWTVESVRPRAERMWEVTIRSATGAPLDFRAGQFGWLAARGERLPIYFDHPFSIASAPQDGTRLRFLIQEAGDFTDRIGELPEGRRVGVDAPHGSFTTDAVEDQEAFVLIAGGVGIAPIVGILEDLAARGETRPVRLIYAAREKASLIDRKMLQPALDALGASTILLADDAQEGDAEIRKGPVSEAHLREALDGLKPERTAALICGPGGMITAVSDTLHEIGMPLEGIHYERFDYGAAGGSAKDRMILNRFRLTGVVVLLFVVAFALR